MKEIATKSRTTEILQKYDLQAKKHLGQNFLIDNNITHKIVKTAGIINETGVIEIGPGIGGLTQVLATQAKKVVSIEIDERLEPVLADTLQDYDNIKIIIADFLKLDLEALIATEFADIDEIVVVANLPYYVTTPILLKILESKTRIKRICAMMQKEVADRLSAKVGTKEYNSLTILTQFYAQTKVVMKVPKNVFIPAPKVDSVVVLFEMNKQRYQVANQETFFQLLRIIFKQRRKTILNNLNEIYQDKQITTDILQQAHIDPKLRAEALTIEQIIELSDVIAKEAKTNGIEKLR